MCQLLSATYHPVCLLAFFVRVTVRVPRVILRTLMMRMMVGLMGREALRSISSSVIPMMDSNTIARSNWFHLDTQTHTRRISVSLRMELYVCL